MSGAVDRRLSGPADERRICAYRPRVDAINALERDLEHLSDDALRARTETFRRQLAADKTTGETSGDSKTNGSADEKGIPACSAR